MRPELSDQQSAASNGSIAFSPPLAYGGDYTNPAFSALPRNLGSHGQYPRHVPAGVGCTLHAPRARYGLAAIAKAELHVGDTVLLPAYHCPALIEPFLWAGCRCRFYRLDQCLDPDPRGFDNLLESSRLVVLVRYFGFDGKIAQYAALARERGCLVIEDLAHAPYIPELYGDYGVTSLPKFYPVDTGSEIWLARDTDPGRLRDLLTVPWHRRQLFQLNSVLQRARQRLRANAGTSAGRRGGFGYFHEDQLKRGLCKHDWAEIARHDASRIIEARRSHYQVLDGVLNRSEVGRALRRSPKRDEVPYVYPYVLQHPESFDFIRNAGIPLFRWKELAPTDCEVSHAYRSRLVQIPCHQDLSGDALALIERTISRLCE